MQLLGLTDHSGSGVDPDKLGVRVPISYPTEQLPGPAAHVEDGVDLARFSGSLGDGGLLDRAEEEALRY